LLKYIEHGHFVKSGIDIINAMLESFQILKKIHSNKMVIIFFPLKMYKSLCFMRLFLF